MNNSTAKHEKILLVLIVITLGFIWINSMLPGETSSDESGFVMKIVGPVLEIFVGKGNVTMHLVRKLAHFTEYFVLGAELTLYSSLRFRGCKKQEIIIPLACGLLAASIDETIQIFASSRGPSIKDVLLDFSGVCTAFILVRIIILFFEKNQEGVCSNDGTQDEEDH